MRTRRQFQPMLDSMPLRIAPSAVAGLSTTLIISASHHITMQTDDTEMPDTGPSTPTPTPTSTSGS
jgi:hypothetical protein